MLVPRENRKDLQEVPKKVRKALAIVLVDYVDEVLREALVLEKPDEFFRKQTVEVPTESGAPAI